MVSIRHLTKRVKKVPFCKGVYCIFTLSKVCHKRQSGYFHYYYPIATTLYMQNSDFVASAIAKLLPVSSVVQCSKADIHWIAQSDKEGADYLSRILDFDVWIV